MGLYIPCHITRYFCLPVGFLVLCRDINRCIDMLIGVQAVQNLSKVKYSKFVERAFSVVFLCLFFNYVFKKTARKDRSETR